MYNKLVVKINNIDISGFVLKTKYDRDKSELEKKLILMGLLKKLNCNAKINEMENKIPIISDLATNATLTAAENKIPNISSLVQIRKDQIIKQYY